MKSKTTIALFLIGFFVLGGAYLVYSGRPVVSNADYYNQLANNTSANQEQVTENQNQTNETGGLTYSLSEVQSHNNETDCWATIDSNVYDLTDWISRHPGGAQRIINLCGIDATGDFEKAHSRSNAAKNALALLKIGTLNQ